MGLKESWQHFKESLVHREKHEETAEEKRQAREWDRALHQSDESSGSETLDDKSSSISVEDYNPRERFRIE